ncbi:MAG: TetR/AcrR family transcriptional regulator, partial [Candidatus Thiodiazotropha sp.]
MIGASGPPRAGRPKSEAKAQAVLDAASVLFLSQGYQGTSMEAVAKEAGVSKQTVYSHFANKEELFKAVIIAKVARYGFDEATEVPDDDLRTALLTIASRFVKLLFDPQVVAMHRVVMGEAASQPRVASLFFDSGPQRTKAAVCAFLQHQVAKGRLTIPPKQISYAAAQLLNMAIGIYQMQLLLGLCDSVDEAELGPHLEQVVEDFLS